jgi:hypothetical protein
MRAARSEASEDCRRLDAATTNATSADTVTAARAPTTSAMLGAPPPAADADPPGAALPRAALAYCACGPPCCHCCWTAPPRCLHAPTAADSRALLRMYLLARAPPRRSGTG